jgi:hypothetical protein
MTKKVVQCLCAFSLRRFRAAPPPYTLCGFFIAVFFIFILFCSFITNYMSKLTQIKNYYRDQRLEKKLEEIVLNGFNMVHEGKT